MTQVITIVIALAIASVFLVPAVWRPTLGRIVLSAMFLGGASYNLLNTLPNTPESLQALVATAPIPPYREVVNAVVGWNAAPLLVVVTIIFEATAGALMLWRGPLVRVSLLAAGVWGLGMLPVIPPDGVLIGIALTGAPGLAGLVLARETYSRSVSLWPLLRRVIEPVPALLIFAALWGLFVVVLHPWFMNWGSTSEEQAMVLPGDTAPPSTYFTRAITINAPTSAVWPWLLAIGQDRAGFFSNDYLENLTGADIHNADTLRLEWQQRDIGDRVPMASPGGQALVGDATLTTIHVLEPERVIADTPGRFVLLPEPGSSTRLLIRESLNDPLRSGALWVLWDPMHFVMEQRMLHGIMERVEGQPFVPPVMQVAAHVGWALAGVAVFAVFWSRRGWRPWLILPVGIMLAPLWLTGDINSFLAGLLAVGITLIGFLAFGWRWLPPYLLVAAGVALVLLLAPDSYAAFGLIFIALGAGFAGAFRARLFHPLAFGGRQPAPVWVFFGLTFVLSWTVWIALFGVAPVNAEAASANPAIFFGILWGGPLVGPALAGILVAAVTGGRRTVADLFHRLTLWRVSIGWYLVALLVTPVMATLTLFILALVVSPRFAPGLPRDWTVVLLVWLAGGVSSLLEEVGWTSFALPRLLTNHRALVAGVVLGAIWGIWHIPLDVWTQAGSKTDSFALASYLVGGGTAVLTLVAYRVLIAWVFVNTGGSLLLGWITHWFLIAGLSPLAFGNVLEPALSPVETLQFYAVFTAIVWLVVGLIVIGFGATTLARAPRRGASPSSVPSSLAA